MLPQADLSQLPKSGLRTLKRDFRRFGCRDAVRTVQQELRRRRVVALPRPRIVVADCRVVAVGTGLVFETVLSDSGGDESAGDDPDPAAVGLALRRCRGAQAAYPSDPALAARLIQQAAQDLRGDAA